MWIAVAISARRILVYNLGNTMITATITKANKTTLQEDGSEFLDIEFDLIEGEGKDATVIDTKRRAFSLDTPAEDIQKEVAAFAVAFQGDRDAAERNKGRDAIHAKADETIEVLLGKKESKVAKKVDN